MSKLPFVCLNIEPESEDDEEIDNTAEIKLEDALKLYQHALKLHAQGPSVFSDAQAAYDELFDNEIFTYGEALSFRKRQEALEEESSESEDDSDSGSEQGFDLLALHELIPATTEGAPSTLRQVVYLSYKNFGQFQLERLQHELNERGVAGEPLNRLEPVLQKRVLTRARKSLELLSDALDKDDSDIELWRQISRLTALLGSQRMTRFCLETVLAANDEDSMVNSDDLVLSVVREELNDVYIQIRDDAAAHELEAVRQKVKIPKRIRNVLEPCPSIPKPAEIASSISLQPRETKVLRLKVDSWAALGRQIIRHLKSGQSPRDEFSSMGSGYRIETASELTARNEEGKSRRRRTTDEVGIPPAGLSNGQEDDTQMGGAEDLASPLGSPSPTFRKGSVNKQQLCSNGDAMALPTRSFLDEQAPQDIENVDTAVQSPVAERANPMKRSPEDAGLPQDPPEARSRSKRLRARETGLDEDATKDQRQHFEKQLKPLQDADRHLFSVADTLLRRLSVDILSEVGTAHDLSDSELPSDTTDASALAAALDDFKKHLKAWNSNKSSLLLHGTGAGATATLISKGNEAGLANFLEHAKSGQQATHGSKPALEDQDLHDLIASVNQSWLSINELALSWLIGLLGPASSSGRTDNDQKRTKYLSLRWLPELKSIVHEMLSILDDYAFKTLDTAMLAWVQTEEQDLGTPSESSESFVAMIQTLFEIQLDMYNSMIKPTSKVDQPTRTLQKARLQRWAFLSSQSIAKRNVNTEDDMPKDYTALRHLYSMTLYLSLDEDSSREHIIQCLQEVKKKVSEDDNTSVSLPNIDIMPEISPEAVDQEISRLTTTDFFMSVFNPSDDDPVATIESLEPIIMPLAGSSTPVSGPRASISEPEQSAGNAASPSGQLVETNQSESPSNPQKVQLLDFLSKSTTSLQLSLWNRLTNAYSAIASPPFVFLCTIHSMKIILSELSTPAYTMQMESTRSSNLLIWIRNLIDLIDKCCTLASTEPTCFDCMDEDNLRLALSSVGLCVRLFHLFALWDDRVRLGQASPPAQQAGAANSYKQAMNLLRDMQVKVWRLLYVLLREAAVQNADLFPDSSDEFLVYIAAVHSAIGLREYCKLGKKSFLKFIKSELLTLQPADLNEWRYQMAQVTYDLYDLRVLADSDTWMTLQEHNCPADPLDRPTAREILPMVMAQIQGLSVRDLTKPDRRDFKQTIDRIQDLIGAPRQSSVQQSFNRRQLLGLQKRAIRGTDLIGAMKGMGGLTNMPVRNEYTAIANTGWYFVIGYLRLASFRAAKRTGPDTTKELDEAMTYLKFDIDFDCEKWETWYRLAQAYDAMLDEEVTWTAERINNKMDDLVTLQRQAIHCYQTAVSLAVRQGDGDSDSSRGQSQDVGTTMSELYSDFGKRLYASSRPPFNMRAFSVHDHARWYFTHTQVKFRDKPFKAMTKPAVWLVASVSFRQAIALRPHEWHNWYMLGKCLWKLLKENDVGGVSYVQVLGAFAKACEIAPHKDSRHPEKGPILEPHFKLLSTVHKLVYNCEFLTPEKGAIWLQKTSYTQKAELKDPKGRREWLTFARQIIRNLRGADKANWHHRIMARAAQMAFEDTDQDVPAEAAILQLTPHIFTKTMVIQVWRTLFERAGRHFVYTTRYVKFFIRLLTTAGDRTSLEALGKKIRKKHAEFIDHVEIWTRICREHVNLLRVQTHVPTLHEETVLFVLPYETFVPNAALLQTWAQPAGAEPPAHPLLTVLREAIDLKKLNLNLIANQGIDDLIGDAYAKLYEEMVPGLVSDATNEKNREAMRVDRILMGDPGVDVDAGIESAVPLTNPSGRAKIVGRMEVRKRAEALVQRVTTAQGPVKGKAAALAEEATAQEEADESEDATAAAASPNASHDADDESELSDLDDEQLEDAQGGEQVQFEDGEGNDAEDAENAESGAEDHDGNSAPRADSTEFEHLGNDATHDSPRGEDGDNEHDSSERNSEAAAVDANTDVEP